MLGRHPPVFAPSPGFGPAVRGAASAAAPFWVRLGGLLAAESPFRSCWSAIVSGPPSLLTAAASFSDTLVSRVPASSAVFLWQGALVSRSSAARGASNWLGALVSRSPSSRQPQHPSTPLPSGCLCCRSPSSYTAASLSRCRRVTCTFLPLNTCTQTRPLSG